MRHIKLPPELPLDLTRFWILHGHEWEACTAGDCYLPVYPDLRLMVEPLCFWHCYCEPATKRAGGKRR